MNDALYDALFLFAAIFVGGSVISWSIGSIEKKIVSVFSGKIDCPCCGNPVSINAYMCPSCGKPLDGVT